VPVLDERAVVPAIDIRARKFPCHATAKVPWATRYGRISRLLIRECAVETHETSLEAHRYLSTDDLREHKKEALRPAA
jgi:hypothetical protein